MLLQISRKYIVGKNYLQVVFQVLRRTVKFIEFQDIHIFIRNMFLKIGQEK